MSYCLKGVWRNAISFNKTLVLLETCLFILFTLYEFVVIKVKGIAAGDGQIIVSANKNNSKTIVI